MLNMLWFFKRGKNFYSFAKQLEGAPQKVYSLLLTKAILHQFWPKTQWNIFWYQFLPYCAFAIVAIAYFTQSLKHTHYYEDAEDLFWRIYLTLTLSGLWLR